MAVNELGFTQASKILAELLQQMTGRKRIAPANFNEFVTVGQVALKCGNEKLLDAISSVMGRTLFSSRIYRGKFSRLRVSQQRFGDHVRKLTMLDQEPVDNKEYELVDGQSVDMYTIRKEDVMQLNFYGFVTYAREMMIWRNQLNVAFLNPEELNRFFAMKLQNVNNQIVQDHEAFARGALCNLILGTITSALNVNRPESLVHIVAEYNVYAGTTFTASEVLRPDNVKNFAIFFYSRMAEIFRKMEERTVLFHTRLSNKENLKRHTPKERMKCYMFAPFMTLLDTAVKSDTFHNEYLKYMDYTPVAFWQNIYDEPPSGISVHPSVPENWLDGTLYGRYTYLDADGTLVETQTQNGSMVAQTTPVILGIIFDEEACGYTVFDEHQNRTPWNASGDYAKIFFKWTNRYWNDFTENAVVIALY